MNSVVRVLIEPIVLVISTAWNEWGDDKIGTLEYISGG